MPVEDTKGCDLRLHISGFQKEDQVRLFQSQLSKFGKVNNIDIPKPVPDLMTLQPTFRGFVYVDMHFENETKFTRFQNAYNNAKWKSLSLRINKARQSYQARLEKEHAQKKIRQKRVDARQRRRVRQVAPIATMTDKELGKREGWETGRYGRAVPTLRIRNPRGRIVVVEAKKVTPRITKFREEDDQKLEKLLAKYENQRNEDAKRKKKQAEEEEAQARKQAKLHTSKLTSGSQASQSAADLKRKINSIFDDDDDDDDSDNDNGTYNSSTNNNNSSVNFEFGDGSMDAYAGDKNTNLGDEDNGGGLFDSSEDEDEDKDDEDISKNHDADKNEDDDEDDTHDIENAFAPRVSAHKAEALLKAQSKIGMDERFQLTEDFLEDMDEGKDLLSDGGADSDDEESRRGEVGPDADEVTREIAVEKNKQLDLLAKLTGKPVVSHTTPSSTSSTAQASERDSHREEGEEEKKKKKKDNLDVWGLQSVQRFDPFADNNTNLLIQEEEEEASGEEEGANKKDKKKKKKEEEEEEEEKEHVRANDDDDANDLDLDEFYEKTDNLDETDDDNHAKKANDEVSTKEGAADTDDTNSNAQSIKAQPQKTFVRINRDIKKDLMPASNNWRDTKSISTFSFGFGGGAITPQTTQESSNKSDGNDDTDDISTEATSGSGVMHMQTSVVSNINTTRNVLSSSLTQNSSSSSAVTTQGRSVQFFFMTTPEYRNLLTDSTKCFVRKQPINVIQEEWEETREDNFAEIKEQMRQAKKRQHRARKMKV